MLDNQKTSFSQGEAADWGGEILNALNGAFKTQNQPPPIDEMLKPYKLCFDDRIVTKNGHEVKAALWANVEGRKVHEEVLLIAHAKKRERYVDACVVALAGRLNPDEESVLRTYVNDTLLAEWTRLQREDERREQEASKLSEEEISEENKRYALELLKSPSLLYRLTCLLPQMRFAGDVTVALLLYLVLTSRLMQKIISVVVKGESSGGKSFLVETLLNLFPRSAYLFMSGMSRQALVYSDQDFRHRMLIVAEANGIESAEYNIRTLLSEGRLVFTTVEQDQRTGRNKSRTVTKEGPTGLVLTTTLPSMHKENETRLTTLTIDESDEQTRDIKNSIAAEYENPGAQPNLRAWVIAQQHLVPLEVRIPYASYLSGRIPDKPLRIRRDFDRLLSFIKASALLHQHQRKPLGGGVIEANLADYFMVKTLYEKPFFSSLYELTDNTRQVMDAITKVYQNKNKATSVNAQPQLVTTQDLMNCLNWKKSKVLRWVKPLEDHGWIEVHGQGRQNEYKPGNDPQVNKPTLPSLEEMAEQFPHLAHGFEVVHPLTGVVQKLCPDPTDEKDEPPGAEPESAEVLQLLQ